MFNCLHLYVLLFQTFLEMGKQKGQYFLHTNSILRLTTLENIQFSAVTGWSSPLYFSLFLRIDKGSNYKVMLKSTENQDNE